MQSEAGDGTPANASREEPAARTRSASATDEPQADLGLQQRNTAASSILSRIPSQTRRSTLGDRGPDGFTLAGPADTSQLRSSHTPFVHPGYSELNPSYEQAPNSKPVWGLAKPLPRVVRPAMVPTKEETLESLQNAERPAQNSQNLGLDVDPNDLEQGQIDKSADPRKIAAPVEDARMQRENNFMNRVLSSNGAAVEPSSRLSRTGLTRPRRSLSAAGGVPPDLLFSGSDEQEHQVPQRYASDKPLQTVPEKSEPPSVRPDNGKLDIPGLEEAGHSEDLHPLIEQLVEDEVHNNHTSWSVIRTHYREALAEALAVYVQLTMGFCADLSVTVANAGNPNTTQWAWGLATMMGICISGGVSGAHLNSAITAMLWFYRGFPKRKMPEYFLAQFLGAFCAAFTAYGLYYQSIKEYRNNNVDTGVITSFVTNQRQPWVDPATAFFTEFLGTAFLAITVLALGDDQNAPPGPGMNSHIIGLVVTCLCITFGYQTGAAFNPARDFGPRLALLALGYGGDLFRSPYWFYGPWAGAVSGGFIGGFLYDFFIFTGGESPVNYPLQRTQRAMKKSRMKWRRRLHLTKQE